MACVGSQIIIRCSWPVRSEHKEKLSVRWHQVKAEASISQSVKHDSKNTQRELATAACVLFGGGADFASGSCTLRGPKNVAYGSPCLLLRVARSLWLSDLHFSPLSDLTRSHLMVILAPGFNAIMLVGFRSCFSLCLSLWIFGFQSVALGAVLFS